jgi:hypothetical protein
MVEKLRKFFRVRTSLKELEMASSMSSSQVNSVLTQIGESGVYQRHFWRSLANIIDEKA